ncbi:MAG: superoxide dismutase [Spirochaetia bacterium]|nr:superoxide dismutase [Spirochaetia bacterium]
MDSQSKYPYELPPLPYDLKSLEPYISANTMSFHYGKHHLAYVNKANELIKGTLYEEQSMLQVMRNSINKDPVIFNNVAQIWNHDFFWKSMKPGDGAPDNRMNEKIITTFGSLEKFNQEFSEAAISQFGSGWIWLVVEGTKMKIMKTSNADNPLVHGIKPLLALDVWEHAYYMDYQNKRVEFVKVFLDHLINWDFANANL